MGQILVFTGLFEAQMIQKYYTFPKTYPMRFTLTSLLFIIYLLSCKNSGSKKSVDSCPYKYSEWMEVSDSTQRKVSAEVDLRFGTSINLLKEILKSGDTSGKAQLNTILKKEKNRNTGKKFKVSQEFFEFYLGKSLDLCAIYDIITKNPNIDSAKRNYYLDRLINISFEYQRHFKPDESTTGKQIINAPVTNYGINNGTMIGALTIEENGLENGPKSIFSANKIENTDVLELGPEKGIWQNPFVAIPYYEKEKVNLVEHIGPIMNSIQQKTSITTEDGTVEVYLCSYSDLITRQKKMQVTMDSLPSRLFYGDLIQKNQLFLLNKEQLTKLFPNKN